MGRKYALASGLLEITYDTGAKVILQGPCTYEVESANGGFLSLGKLTARVEKARSGTGVRIKSQIPNPKSPILSSALPPPSSPTWAPSSAWKSDKEGDTISHVFRGSVRVQAAGGGSKQHDVVLRENESARVDNRPDQKRPTHCPRRWDLPARGVRAQ